MKENKGHFFRMSPCFLLMDISGHANCDIMLPKASRAGSIMTFQRITINPEVCGGKPSIRGLRFPVSRLLGLLASGETQESILKSYPYLEPEDIQEALNYTAFLAKVLQ
jgi:uncharacterized protein (DUF433 family)